MEMEFRKLVNPYRRGGMARRKILEYIAAHPGTTPYEVAKNVFGDGPTYTAQVLSNIKRLTFVGGVEFLKMERDERGKYHLYLTEKGRKLCQAEGLQLPSGKPWLFITELNRQLEKPLTPEELAKLESLLTEPVLQALEEIGEVFRPTIFSPSPPSLLSALWTYEAEKELIRERVEEKVKKFIPFIFRIYPGLKTFRKKAEEECRKILEKADLKTLIQKSLFCVSIAQKHGVEEQLDKLLDFVIPLSKRGKEALLNRQKMKEIYAYRLGFGLQMEVVRRMGP